MASVISRSTRTQLQVVLQNEGQRKIRVEGAVVSLIEFMLENSDLASNIYKQKSNILPQKGQRIKIVKSAVDTLSRIFVLISCSLDVKFL